MLKKGEDGRDCVKLGEAGEVGSGWERLGKIRRAIRLCEEGKSWEKL